MTTTVTTVRLPAELINKLDERAREEHVDRTTALKKFLEEAIKNWKLEEAAKAYKEGRLSLGGAAKKAGLSIDEIMTELVKRGVKSDLTLEEYQESISSALKLFKA
ncbi:MAG TPA: UPF0175 family protein [archaeon]|nr:UPF0175 family protein [archaeon]HLD81356.1 UPF0175 family protein [archaeon]